MKRKFLERAHKIELKKLKKNEFKSMGVLSINSF